jgi:Ca2+-transporting ATPase
MSPWIILKNQFESVIVWLLIAAALLSFYFGDFKEAGAIVAVLLINSGLGFATELKAVRSMESLRRMSEVRTRVRRGSKVLQIPAANLVPGDIVLLESGDLVTADLRLIETTNLEIDESTLTGESVPVAKSPESVPADCPLGDRASMVFKGTAVTRGSGIGVTTATGMSTQLGRIAELADSARSDMSPLEKRLDRLGSQLVWATLLIMPVVFASGFYTGQEALLMAKTAVALAVAAIPEGLPIVATVALARGMWRMARRNALIERLDAVETLGATTIILTDKTGTLTENRMTAVEFSLAEQTVEWPRGKTPGSDPPRSDLGEGTALSQALKVAVLCNDASLPGQQESPSTSVQGGDPMEIALLEAGRKAGIERNELLATLPLEREESFSTDTKMMATVHRSGRGYLVAAKGAPEAVLQVCSYVQHGREVIPLKVEERNVWSGKVEAMAQKGLRVLGLATKQATSVEESCYEQLTLLGLVGLLDPPRPDVAAALDACRTAGVRVVMLTGDHAVTALAIAQDLRLAGEDELVVIETQELEDLDHLATEDRARILEASVFARISPEAKLDLVSLYQKEGGIVAMTGDGVNDAPALKKADIGIAMGRRGTEVAREAADMVLRDDAFPSIVAAMFQGRVIFNNIRKFVVYLLSCNLSEILVIGIATTAGLPLPLLPLQILFLNLVTDVFPAFALGVCPGDPEVMRRPPRNTQEGIMERRHWLSVGGYAMLITVATLAAFMLALVAWELPESSAVTIAFLTLAFAQIWHVFNMRSDGSSLWVNEITRNPWVWSAVLLCLAVVLVAVNVPYVAGILSFSSPDPKGWALTVLASLVPLLCLQTHAALRYGKKQRPIK